jgi:polyphosphate kinase
MKKMEEQLSDLERDKIAAKLARAQRSENPTVSTRKMINALLLMGDRLPIGTSLSGEVVSKFVAQIEAKGFEVPDMNWTKLDTTEKRSLQTAFDKKVVGVTIPFKVGATVTPVSKLSDAELNAKIERQQKQFEAMLAAEEKPDPLLKLAKVRAQVPRRKGTESKEDKALFEANERMKRG